MNGAVLMVLRRHFGGRIPENPRGDELYLRCPIHKGGNEKTPSFQISLNTGASRCYRCQSVDGIKGWSLYGLLVAAGVSRELAKQELVDLGLWDARPGEAVVRERKVAPLLPEYVLAAYYACPVALLEAGFRADILHDYEIGYDRMNRRWTYPLRDASGGIVAIIGRNTDKDAPARYKVYREELGDLAPAKDEVVPVHEHLWNFHRLAPVCRTGRLPYLVAVEGVKKALWLIQHGWEYVVTLNGSKLSKEQEKLLKGSNPPGVFYGFTDDDEPGRRCQQEFVERLGGWSPVVLPRYPRGVTQLDSCTVADMARMMPEWQGGQA